MYSVSGMLRMCAYSSVAVAKRGNAELRLCDGAQVTALRQEVARLQLLLQVSEAKVAMWEECMQTFLHAVMLSPEMNDMYKDECTRILRSTLGGVEQIQAVRFVDCSFPSVPTEVCCRDLCPDSALQPPN